jgi:hypothetical protein
MDSAEICEEVLETVKDAGYGLPAMVYLDQYLNN